jgi:hypothetical protein
MPERLFLFMQMEFPWELGPSDGRYMLREQAGAEPKRIVVFGTLGAVQRRRRGSRGGRSQTTAEAAQVTTTRATVIDPISVSSDRQAKAWLASIDSELETQNAVAVLNRVLFAQRIASANPYVHEVHSDQALIIRAGWGEGEQVADGRWSEAQQLKLSEPRSRRRVSALRPQERLAVLLGAREEPLLCEELTLRVRLDLDQGRLAHAATGLDRAYAAALVELGSQARADLTSRVSELEELRSGVAQAAKAAIPGGSQQPDEEIVRQALERLEAALRARTAVGFATSA